MRHDVDAWLRRPYGNRAKTGLPLLAEDHPAATTYDLAPDHRLGSDMLGWPNPRGAIRGYITSDEQHRSDNLLWAMIQLTRNPHLIQCGKDILQLDLMDYRRKTWPAPHSGCRSPRGWGRPLLSWCHALAAGFDEARELVDHMIERMWQAASYRADPTGDVQPLSLNEPQYGWRDQAGKQIYGWLPWQESIAIIGLYAAYKQTGDERAEEMCITAAANIARYGFYQWEGRWRHCWAVRSNGFQSLDPSLYTPAQPNMHVLNGNADWTLPALEILLKLDPDNDAAPRAARILNAYGPPKTWDQACWRAV